MENTLVFPGGTSFGNTYQIVRTAIESRVFSAVKILTTPQTQVVNQYLVSSLDGIDGDCSVDCIPMEIFLKNPARSLAASGQVDFLMGPSTVEHQLSAFAAVCTLGPPRVWSILEKKTKKEKSSRDLRSYDGEHSIEMVEISGDEIHEFLPAHTAELIARNDVSWTSSTARFNYHIDFHSMKGKTKIPQRKWEQKEYVIIEELRESLGMHGLTITHSSLPDYWKNKDGVLRRLSARRVREVSK